MKSLPLESLNQSSIHIFSKPGQIHLNFQIKNIYHSPRLFEFKFCWKLIASIKKIILIGHHLTLLHLYHVIACHE